MTSRLFNTSPLFNRVKGAAVRKYTSKATLHAGDNVLGYRVQQVRRIPELELTAVSLEHTKTGAKHLHIDREDNNNVFAVGFHTPVKDSTGVPHILEHTTLCGSEKYPVRDPFFKMLNRSLATFMNAFTASDFTVYPFATTNKVDYRNLQSVYTDAVFKPKLEKLDFAQEGWRLEHKVPTDVSTPIQFKGIVYNEMKGQTSDANYLFYSRAQEAMFPGTAYEHSSGGDPPFIPDLTHEQLVKFHREHYHPSNARFYTYGNIPLEEHLATIGKRLDSYSRIELDHVNKVVTPWTEPKRIQSTFALDPLSASDKQNKLSVSYLANDIKDTFETFSLRLLSYLLLDGHASPMYKALIETNLGSEFSANTGFDSSTRLSSFSVGLQGISDSDIEKVEEIIDSVLNQVKKDGFDSKRIEAAIHQIELGQKHKTADFGLTIMNGICSGWFNDVDPIDMLEINKNIERLKKELTQGNFFESRIDKYLLNNKHKLTYIMTPDANYNNNLTTAEQLRLSQKIEKLTDADKKEILEQGKLLLKNQDKAEDLSCLPTLHLSDISTKTKRTALDHTGLCNTPVQWRTTGTNGITYFRAISNLPSLPDELKMYLPLFCDALLSLGTKNQSMGEIDDEIRLYTGGLRASTTVTTNHSDIDVMEEGIALTGNCLDRNIDRMYDILSKLVLETNFDNLEKLRTLIIGNASGIVNSIADSGHVFARAYAGSTLTPAVYNTELLSGLTQANFISGLANLEDVAEISNKLKEIANFVLKQDSLRVAITCGDDAVSANTGALIKFIEQLPTEHSIVNPNTPKFVPKPQKTFFPLPFSVNFSASVLRGVPYTHEDGAKYQVLSSLMTNHYLHKEIREKNGAYGGGAQYAGINGLFSFYSYRDPHTLETLDTYQSSLKWVLQREFSDQELTEAKLSIFQSVDAPLSVSEEGMLQFVYGISDQMRQWRREQFLAVTQADIRQVAEKLAEQQASMVILGEQNDQLLSKLQGWEIKKFGE
ncbi:peptidase M16C associated-domain-containing protein [Cunninghamella echinulata]|nr:peptidase M16C associated-domain-containing protein [Cunninghamella echinulata]